MAIPILYHVKSVIIRWHSSLITAFTVGLAIFILAFSFAIQAGLEQAQSHVPQASNVLVFQRGVSRFPESFLAKQTYYQISTLPEIAQHDKQPLVAPEIVTLMNTPRDLGENSQAFIRLRGVKAEVTPHQKQIEILKGRMFRPGLNEVMIGKSLAEMFPELAVGKTLTLGKHEWQVVGHFSAKGPGYDIEIWADVEQIYSNFQVKRYNAVALTLKDPQLFAQVKQKLEDNKNLNVSVYKEQEYYRNRIEGTMEVFHFLGMLIFVLMAIAGVFSTVNTMYANIFSRIREIATLRAIGFSKLKIYVGFLLESCFTTVCGGVVALLLLIPLDNFTITKWQTLSEISYNITITPHVIQLALFCSLILGVLGGLLPAWSAARLQVAEVLRK